MSYVDPNTGQVSDKGNARPLPGRGPRPITPQTPTASGEPLQASPSQGYPMPGRSPMPLPRGPGGVVQPRPRPGMQWPGRPQPAPMPRRPAYTNGTADHPLNAPNVGGVKPQPPNPWGIAQTADFKGQPTVLRAGMGGGPGQAYDQNLKDLYRGQQGNVRPAPAATPMTIDRNTGQAKI